MPTQFYIFSLSTSFSSSFYLLFSPSLLSSFSQTQTKLLNKPTKKQNQYDKNIAKQNKMKQKALKKLSPCYLLGSFSPEILSFSTPKWEFFLFYYTLFYNILNE